MILDNLKKLTSSDEKVAYALYDLYTSCMHLFYDTPENGISGLREGYNYKPFRAIPFNPQVDFINFLIRLKRSHDKLTFMDIGCGKGNMLALARAVGYETQGIELHRYSPYHRCTGVDFTFGDALELTTFNADIIYMYRPIIDEETLHKLVQHVVRFMSKDALFIPVGWYGKKIEEVDPHLVYVGTDLDPRPNVPLYMKKQ